LLHRLGVADLPEFHRASALALAEPPGDLAPALLVLVAANLATGLTGGRYRVHDLVRLAARRSASPAGPDRRAILGRLAHAYVHRVARAMSELTFGRTIPRLDADGSAD